MKINRYVLSELTIRERQALLSRVDADLSHVAETVNEIIDDVRKRGDQSLLDYTAQFDGVSLGVDQLTVTAEEFDRAEAELDPKIRAAIETAVANIQAHHRAQLPVATWMREDTPGVIAGERWTPIASAGLYVPRGKGSFPSVMMMLCVPAVLAGVSNLVVCTPPGPNGVVDAASLVAARLCGVEHIVKVGGAQAIAALAFGTETVPRVEKIVGPGNQYVTAAKKAVYGYVDPGPPAGPSESIVLADEHADPEIAARELLVEAEHGPDSAALLVTHSGEVADAVARLVPSLLAALPAQRRTFCETVLSGYGGIVLTDGLAASVDFVNDYAPEHLRVLVNSPFEVLHDIVNAGEILLGAHTAIPFGNFVIGVNAILPTGGKARAFSCVGVLDFMKRSSFAYVTAHGVQQIGPAAVTLAEYEGFPAHAAAASYIVDR